MSLKIHSLQYLKINLTQTGMQVSCQDRVVPLKYNQLEGLKHLLNQ